MSTDWVRTIRDQFESSRELLNVEGMSPDDEPVRFWELGIELSQETVRRASNYICQESIRRRSPRYPEETSLLLMYLLRAYLTDVRANKMWPPVARMLSRFADGEIDGHRCGMYFREALRDTYADRLEPVHNRFVMLALDESGIGWNRTAIVSSFLRNLIEQTDTTVDEDISSVVEKHLNTYVRGSEASEDIMALASVLRRTGENLLHLALALRESGRSLECSLWEWSELRSYWREHADVDLGRLIPEAQELFMEMVQHVGRRISRQGLARRLAQGRYEVGFPSCISDQSGPSHARALPLTPVRMRAGDTVRDVVVTDEYGMTADRITQKYGPNTWHKLTRRQALYWSEDAFRVIADSSYRESSVPLVVGQSLDNARYIGHYWVGRADGSLRVEGGPPLDVEPEMKLHHEWFFDNGKFLLRVAGFETRGLPHPLSISLAVAGREMWSGRLTSSSFSEFFEHEMELLADDGEAIEAQILMQNGSTLCKMTLTPPASNDAILTVDGQIRRPGTVRLAAHDSEVLIHVSGERELYVSGGGNVKELREKASDRLHTYRIVRESWQDVSVRSRGVRWRILWRTQEVRLNADGNAACIVDGVSFTATNGLIPVHHEDPMNVCFRGEALDHSRGRSLIVTLRTSAFRWSLIDVMSESDIQEEGCRVSILDFLLRQGIDVLCGPISVELRDRSGNTEDSVLFYRMGESIHHFEAVIGESADFEILAEGEPVQRFSSSEPVSYSGIIAGEPLQAEISLVEGCSIRAEWVPPVRDVLLMDDGQPVIGEQELDLGMVRRGCNLVFLGAPNSDWKGRVGGKDTEFEGSSLSLYDAFSMVACRDGADHVISLFCNGELTSQWSMNTRPVNVRVSCEWIGRLNLRVYVEWYGLQSHEPVLTISAGKVTLLDTICNSDGRTLDDREFIADIAVPQHLVVGGGTRNLGIEVSHGSVVLLSEHCDMPRVELSDPELLAEAIVRSYESLSEDDTHADEMLENVALLTERYLRVESDPPFESEQMIAAMRTYGSVVVRRVVATALRLMDPHNNDIQLQTMMEFPSKISPRLKALVLTLQAVKQVQLSEQGLARPSILGRISEQMDEVREETTEDELEEWSLLMVEFCREKCRELREGVNPEACQRGGIHLDDPLVAFHDELSNWLRKKLTGSDAFDRRA